MVRLAAPFRLRRPRICRSTLRPSRDPGGPVSGLAAFDGPGRRTPAGSSLDVPAGRRLSLAAFAGVGNLILAE